MRLFNYELTINMNAIQPWTHFKIHRHPRNRWGHAKGKTLYRHLVWGRISIIWGQPHLEEIGICALCESTEIGEECAGDEGWTVCRDCGAVEQGYEYITIEEAEKRGVAV